MRSLLPFFALLTLASLIGCNSPGRQGSSFHDPYDDVQVDQMSGNHVSGRVFERTIVCLNARRETRLLTLETNQTVAWVTNLSVVPITNLTVTLATNSSRTFATNQVPPAPPVPAAEDAPAAEVVADATPSAPPSTITNVTVTANSNTSVSKSPAQTLTTASHQTVTSSQVTLTTGLLSVTTAENLAATAETNQTVTLVTNLSIVSVTNTLVLATNRWVRDYYLTVEFTAPPDFSLAPGHESLNLLVDGQRYALSPGTPQTPVLARRGFQAAIYRATPELLVNLANAREAQLRLRGVNAAIEKRLSRSSLQNFRAFVSTHFTPPPDPAPLPEEAPLASLPPSRP